jgi:hypothetical protein
VTTRPPHPGPSSPAHPSHSQQRRGDDDNVTIATAQSPQRRHWHHCARLAHTSSSSRPWPARPRVHNGDVAITTTQRSQPHYRHVIIVTAILSPRRRRHCARLACTSSSSRPRTCNTDVATTTTRRSQLHYRHIVIVTAILSPCHRRHHARLVHTSSSSRPWSLARMPSRAQQRRGDDDDVMIATASLSRRHRDRHLAMCTHACLIPLSVRNTRMPALAPY